MTNRKVLNVENLVRAQCIFVSKGHDYEDIKDPEYLKRKYGEHWIEEYAGNAVRAIQSREGSYELIFNVIGSDRCRLMVSPPSRRGEFSESEYELTPTHLNHFWTSSLRGEVEDRFERILEALLEEGFPAVKGWLD
ncbi:hypothetical protein HN832_04585 [archaeon]|jgi:hypothetical protein|nr:hypothetical protein [archaeon]MBT4373970.1 hypothetical protein [archaeon]MBT4532199.1 hypothetical protein [archaeon]MBT7001956.1 hypothetical protein [archaeon]MBT7282663.1 hypothetical protein [archaeon]